MMMSGQQTHLEKRLESGQPVLIVEVAPPRQGDADAVRACAKRYTGKVHALGVSDNRDEVRMSALAAASLITAEGVEPILHVVTRDRNRIALASEGLGAQALGVGNLLCTTGTHQTLGCCGHARNVFDVDSIQLLQMYSQMARNGNGDAGSLCLGAAVSSDADPLELQVMKLAKKAAAGAKFVITQPVFDLERFNTWWREVTERGLQERLAIIAGIKLLTDADTAKAFAEQRPRPMIPNALIERLSTKADASAQRSAGIEIACEIIAELAALNGLRGFEIRSDGDDDATLELLDKAGLRCD
jgi:methylenetetrahydrofolate reductase (NADPH)